LGTANNQPTPQATLAGNLAPTAAQLGVVLASAAVGAVDPAAILGLIAALLPGAISLYQTIAAQYEGPSKSMEEILGTADANWDAISAAAKGQLG
jgi:hypothetical protein